MLSAPLNVREVLEWNQEDIISVSLKVVSWSDLDSKKIKTDPRRRICGLPECDQCLSMYNHNKYCFSHQLKGIAYTENIKEML